MHLVGVSATAAFAAALLCEVLLRLLLFTSLPQGLTRRFRDPGLFAYPDEDDYWKLRTLWFGLWTGAMTMGPFHHPQLGFTTPRTDGNPLGVAGLPRRAPDSNSRDPTILFFGDSFLTGPFLDIERRIPQLLESRLGGIGVWNFGMWSYGLDQIVLRFELTLRHFGNPHVIIGILTDDVERCVLSVRQGQKPRFVLNSAGELQLTNVPVEDDQAAYLRDHPPEIRSYFLRLVRMGVQQTFVVDLLPRLRKNFWVEEKKALATALIGRAVHRGRAAGVPVRFVIFYMPDELTGASWRADVLRSTFDSLGAAYLDTSAPLHRALDAGTVSLAELYDETQHHTPRANELIVDAMLAAWPDLAVVEPRARVQP
jgi:hypothetical protein